MDDDTRLVIIIGSIILIFCLSLIIPQAYRQRQAEIEKARKEEAYRQEQYDKALEELQNGSYGWAAYYLDEAGYGENTVLRLYVKARSLYSHHDADSIEAYTYLNRIPLDYDGDLADEIRLFREEAESNRTEIQALHDRHVTLLKEMEQLSQQNANAGSSKNTKKKSSSSKKSSAKSDPYDVYDYSHADDFYYDHWDDFTDFEEAEDYFDEHQ